MVNMNFKDMLNQLLLEAAYDSKIQAMKAKYPEYQEHIDWAKPNLQRQDRIVWYLNILEKTLKNPNDINFHRQITNSIDFPEFKEKLFHFVGQLNIPKIQSYVFTNQPAGEVFDDLTKLEQEFHANQQPEGRYDPELGDVELLKFPDGTRWVKLNTAYCEKEGKSGKHCGNLAGQTSKNQRILSFRDRNNRAKLTFILEPNNKLGEMRGMANTKPKAMYHPYITQLLIQPYIKGTEIRSRSSEFDIMDLDARFLTIINHNNPLLIEETLLRNPMSIFKMPDEIKNDNFYRSILPTVIRNTISNPTPDNLKKLILYNSNPTKVLNMFSKEKLDEIFEDREFLIDFWKKNINSLKFDKLPSKVRYDLDFYKEIFTKYINSINIWSLTDIMKNVTPKWTEYDEFVKLYVDLLYKKSADYWVWLDTNPLSLIDPSRLNEDMILKFLEKKKNGYVIKGLPTELLTDEICSKAVKYTPKIISDNSFPKNKITKKMASYVLSRSGKLIRYIPAGLLDENVYIKTVSRHGNTLVLVPYESRTRKVCEAAIKSKSKSKRGNMCPIKHIPERFLDKKMYKLALENGIFLSQIPKNLRKGELLVTAIKSNNVNVSFIPKEFYDKKIANMLLEQDFNFLQNIPEKFITRELLDRHIKNMKTGNQWISYNAILNIPEKIWDKNLVLDLLDKSKENSRYWINAIPKKLKTPELLKLYIQHDPLVLFDFMQDLWTYDLYSFAVNNYPKSFENLDLYGKNKLSKIKDTIKEKEKEKKDMSEQKTLNRILYLSGLNTNPKTLK